MRRLRTTTARASATITINAPELHVRLAADSDRVNAGDAAGFTVTIRNDGPGDATGVTLSASLPAGLGNDIGWAIDPNGADAGFFRVTGRLVPERWLRAPRWRPVKHGPYISRE